MDIRAKIVLDLVKSIKGAENSVIAGGAVRDMMFQVPNKDVDIFIPYKTLKEVKSEISKLDENIVPKSKDYEKVNPYRKAKSDILGYYPDYSGDKFEAFGFEFEGVKFDLITSYAVGDESFGDKVIDRFDYGLNMVYYDGISIVDNNEEFKTDFNNRVMTLRRLDSINDLPKMVNRYNSISERFFQNQHWKPGFRCSVLTIKKPKKSKEDDLKIDKITIDDINNLADAVGQGEGPFVGRGGRPLRVAAEELQRLAQAAQPFAQVDPRPVRAPRPRRPDPAWVADWENRGLFAVQNEAERLLDAIAIEDDQDRAEQMLDVVDDLVEIENRIVEQAEQQAE